MVDLVIMKVAKIYVEYDRLIDADGNEDTWQGAWADFLDVLDDVPEAARSHWIAKVVGAVLEQASNFCMRFARVARPFPYLLYWICFAEGNVVCDGRG